MAFPARLPAVWLANAAARLALASGVGYVAAAYTVSRFLTHPRRKRLRTTPAELGLPFEQVELVAADRVKLTGWLVEPPAPRGTVALFHGMRQNREQMLGRMAFLHAAGYRSIAIDHRAHGSSRGKRVSFGWYEARDVAAVAEFIRSRWPDQPRVALGISMGAAAITFAGPNWWDGAILEGIYSEVGIAFRRRVGRYYPKWFGQLSPGVMWITQRRIKVTRRQLRPLDAIRAFKEVPTLLVTGEQDFLAPPDDSRAVAAAAGSRAEVFLVPGAGHSNVAEVGGPAYREKLLGFLDGLQTE